MKRLVCLIFPVFLLFLLSSCSLPEKKETPEDNISLDETGEIVGEPIDYFRTVNITMEKLEVESYFGKKYVFNGVKIQEDNGMNYAEAMALLQTRRENDNICAWGEPNIELKFTDIIPQSVTWYNHYYLITGECLYPSLWQTNTIDDVDDSVIISIGIYLGNPLDSSYPADLPLAYRIIRIVCDFDDQMVEYYIFIDE